MARGVVAFAINDFSFDDDKHPTVGDVAFHKGDDIFCCFFHSFNFQYIDEFRAVVRDKDAELYFSCCLLNASSIQKIMSVV